MTTLIIFGVLFFVLVFFLVRWLTQTEEVIVVSQPQKPRLPARIRVLAGARLLDKEHEGWEPKINLDMFDIRFSRGCTLGQVFGSYQTGLQTLHIQPGQEVDYGFLWYDDSIEVAIQDTKELEKAWKDYITLRKEVMNLEARIIK